MNEEKIQIRKVKKYLSKQASLDTLRFITCGSVDDGKSTLIGRMLFEANVIFDDQIKSLKDESLKKSSSKKELDFSLLLDGLSAEREQGITIDVAYRFFSTVNRKFIVGDTPGHEQYTRNMVTAASTADLAIILIDSSKGILLQTRRHSLICSALGIKHVILAVNKMDLINFSQEIFNKISKDFTSIFKDSDFKSITPIPLSGLHGDNIINKSKNTDWYEGPTLIKHLETIDVVNSEIKKPMRLPVQWVNRPNSNFRGFSGMITSGEIKVGDEICILPSLLTAKVKKIILYKDELKSAIAGQSITITLNRDIDISRGDLIVSKEKPCEISDHFETKLIWISDEIGYAGRYYLFKIGSLLINAQITKIKRIIDIETLKKISRNNLNVNDFSVVTIKTDEAIPFEPFTGKKSLGGFILIDKISHQTVGCGMINYALRRTNNLTVQKLDINKNKRQILNGHKSMVIWLTGISGSGKSTIANELEKELYKRKILSYTLDGDNIRKGINKDLGFTTSDRIENIRRISEIAKILVDSGVVVITAFISPFRAEREMARKLFEKKEFYEVFVDTPLSVAESRDVKGLYKKARDGKLPNFTGIDSPYEEPSSPELKLSTVNFNVKKSVETILKKINLF